MGRITAGVLPQSGGARTDCREACASTASTVLPGSLQRPQLRQSGRFGGDLGKGLPRQAKSGERPADRAEDRPSRTPSEPAACGQPPRLSPAAQSRRNGQRRLALQDRARSAARSCRPGTARGRAGGGTLPRSLAWHPPVAPLALRSCMDLCLSKPRQRVVVDRQSCSRMAVAESVSDFSAGDCDQVAAPAVVRIVLCQILSGVWTFLLVTEELGQSLGTRRAGALRPCYSRFLALLSLWRPVFRQHSVFRSPWTSRRFLPFLHRGLRPVPSGGNDQTKAEFKIPNLSHPTHRAAASS
jgi:hypothetical protein